MSLPAGTRFGSYEILAPLGAGGMGEVEEAERVGALATVRGRSSVLFRRPVDGPGADEDAEIASRDGQRFLVLEDSSPPSGDEVERASMVVVQNWFTELTARLSSVR